MSRRTGKNNITECGTLKCVRREREGLFSTIQQHSCENGQHQNTKWRVARKA